MTVRTAKLTDHTQGTITLLQLLRPERKPLHLALLLAIAGSLLFILQAHVLAYLFATGLTASSQGHPINLEQLQPYLLPLLLCLCLRPMLQYGREQLSLRASQRIRQQLRLTLLDKLAAAGSGKSQYGSDGRISNLLLEQVDALDGFISRYYVQRYLVLITPILLAGATFYYSRLAGAILLLTAPLVPVFMVLLGNAAASASSKQLRQMSRMSGRFLDLVRGINTLRQLNATGRATQSVANAAEQYRDSSMGVLKLAFLSSAVLEFFSALAIALLALYLGLGLLGILPWAKGEIPVAYQGALFILLLAPEFYAPLRQLGSDYHAKAQAEAALDALQPLLQQRAWQAEGKLTPDLSSAPAICIQQLSLVGDHNRRRLDSFSLTLEAKARIGLQGQSGSGKSSLLQALLGFIPYQGKLLINGIELNSIAPKHWQRHLGYLAQHSPIDAASIAENLRLAKSNATDEQLKLVLQQVELWPLIAQLPLGLATPLGERGLGLSGGQLQRLALAQLLLQDAPLWLLDEPCAQLDEATSSRLHQLIGKLSTDKTVVLVSHQLNGLDWLDSVVTLPMLTTHHSSGESHV